MGDREPQKEQEEEEEKQPYAQETVEVNGTKRKN